MIFINQMLLLLAVLEAVEDFVYQALFSLYLSLRFTSKTNTIFELNVITGKGEQR